MNMEESLQAVYILWGVGGVDKPWSLEARVGDSYEGGMQSTLAQECIRHAIAISGHDVISMRYMSNVHPSSTLNKHY